LTTQTLRLPTVSESKGQFVIGEPKRLLIGGKWAAAREGGFESIYLATGEVSARICDGREGGCGRRPVRVARAYSGSWPT
jgi:hypothetical protein